MDFFLETLAGAVRLIFSADADAAAAVVVSLQVSLCSVLICAAAGFPAAYALWSARFPGRKAVLVLVHALMGTPTVAIGLFLYIVISRRGPAGGLDLLFTKKAMILGQAVLGLPIVISLAHSALSSLDPRAMETALTLGAGRVRCAVTMLVEARSGFAAALITAFGRLLGEVGVSMMLGGNIAGKTRNISTAMALETGKGEAALGLALGLILLATAVCINVLLKLLQGGGRESSRGDRG